MKSTVLVSSLVTALKFCVLLSILHEIIVFWNIWNVAWGNSVKRTFETNKAFYQRGWFLCTHVVKVLLDIWLLSYGRAVKKWLKKVGVYSEREITNTFEILILGIMLMKWYEVTTNCFRQHSERRCRLFLNQAREESLPRKEKVSQRER